jgi:hypothetical protein
VESLDGRRETKLEFTDGNTVVFGYDANGNVTSVALVPRQVLLGFGVAGSGVGVGDRGGDRGGGGGGDGGPGLWEPWPRRAQGWVRRQRMARTESRRARAGATVA